MNVHLVVRGFIGDTYRTRRRRDAAKALLLALTAVVVSTWPLLGFRAFVYALGIVVAAGGLVAAGMLLELYVGFRRFERWTADAFDRARRHRLVRR